MRRTIWQPPLPIDSSAHWWMMQAGMILGFFTAYPVNRWLVRKGWKEKMDHRVHVAEMIRQERAGADEPTLREREAERSVTEDKASRQGTPSGGSVEPSRRGR